MIPRSRRASLGWSLLSEPEKADLIDRILSGKRTDSPRSLDIYVTDRCNVNCYFCSTIDMRTTQELPVPKLAALLRSLAPRGLKSIRFVGGGDPLAHRQIGAILEAVRDSGVHLENVTTNGVGLSEAVAKSLVALNCDEVLISLNASSAAEYARMMRVKSQLFEKVKENVVRLREIRGRAQAPVIRAQAPVIVVQFLIDRANHTRLAEMYGLGRILGADLIALNAVRLTAHTPPDLVLHDEDFDVLRPQLEQIFEADRVEERLVVCFPFARWNDWMAANGLANANAFTTAPSYSESIGKCFFGWYAAVVTGSGDVYPCCALTKPGYAPMGNIHTSEFESIWNGREFDRLRYEMREAFLTDGKMPASELQRLEPGCIAENVCWLKTFTFRHDEAFYAALKTAVEKKRALLTPGTASPLPAPPPAGSVPRTASR